MLTRTCYKKKFVSDDPRTAGNCRPACFSVSAPSLPPSAPRRAQNGLVAAANESAFSTSTQKTVKKYRLVSKHYLPLMISILKKKEKKLSNFFFFLITNTNLQDLSPHPTWTGHQDTKKRWARFTSYAFWFKWGVFETNNSRFFSHF